MERGAHLFGDGVDGLPHSLDERRELSLGHPRDLLAGHLAVWTDDLHRAGIEEREFDVRRVGHGSSDATLHLTREAAGEGEWGFNRLNRVPRHPLER